MGRSRRSGKRLAGKTESGRQPSQRSGSERPGRAGLPARLERSGRWLSSVVAGLERIILVILIFLLFLLGLISVVTPIIRNHRVLSGAHTDSVSQAQRVSALLRSAVDVAARYGQL